MPISSRMLINSYNSYDSYNSYNAPTVYYTPSPYGRRGRPAELPSIMGPP